MDETVKSFAQSQLLSLTQAVEWLRPLSEEKLYDWLAEALEKGRANATPPHTQWDIDTFLVDVYRECDPGLQLRLRSAFASLLESFVPSLTPNKNAAYLSALLTLGSNLRSKRVKERLRRWLYADMFKDSYYLGANLHGDLILATSVYDVDDEWLHHIKTVLPTKSFFPKVARHTYRALLDTVGIGCMEALPDVLRSINREDNDERVAMGYLLRLSMKKFGREMFLNKTAEVFSTDWRVENVFENTLNLEEFLKAAFPNETDQEELIEDLDVKIWTPWADKWRDLDVKRSTETFTAIMLVCKPEPVEQFYVRDALGALAFRGGRHHLVVPKSHEHLKGYFEFAAHVMGAAAGAGR